MIGKVMKNNSFRATVKYVIEKEKAAIIGGNMVGTNTAELTKEFMMSRDLNREIKRPVYHFSLSLPKHEYLDDENFSSLAKTYLAGMIALDKGERLDENKFASLVEMDLSQYQFLVARHGDKDHDHVHIIASRINLIDGKAVETWHDHFRSQKIIRQLEQVYQLEAVRSSWEVGKKAPTKSQLEKLAKTGEPSVQFKLQSAIEGAATDCPTLPEFLDRLHSQALVTG
jgi:hypothetical protein